jgi:alpha-ketoglutarate-dependent taurine dioxygenase
MIYEEIMAYETITATPVSPVVGAVVGDIDLTKPLTNRQVQDLHEALIEYQVLFFRNQKVDFESLKALGRHFGKLHISVGGDGTNSKQLKSDPEVRALHFDQNSEQVSGERWHTDQSCAAIPPMGSVLYLHTTPPKGGGDTMFASMTAAYDGLSPRMKVYLEGLTAVHDGARAFARTATNNLPVTVQPIIAKHPVSGRKLLYVNRAFTSRICELSEDESEGILNIIFRHCEHVDFQYRFRWEPHSIAFWDNRATHHRAIWDYYPNVRSGYRIQIEGTGPVLAA